MKKMIWLPAILLMVAIFYFSSQPAEVSSDLSGGISYRIVQLVRDISGKDWSQEDMLLLAERMDFPVRKLAHLTEYALLGAALSLGVIYGSHWSRYSRKWQYFLIQAAGSLYAASDEIHQLFVPGRAGQARDVLIDSIGVLIGYLILKIFGIFMP